MPDRKIEKVYKGSSEYPVLLSQVKDSPDPLYFLGDFSPEIFENTLAVVGSRAMTLYGEWVVRTIVRDVCLAGITIVSGFMYGIDATAHQVALDEGGKTIAVMASGVDNVFPKYQQALFDAVVERGLVVSEYEAKGAEGKWMFARRNRIVAGLSKAVLIVEAGESSGSLITAELARKYHRRVLVVPGNLNAPNSYGFINLLKHGATLVTTSSDILELYDRHNKRKQLNTAVKKRLIKGIGGELVETSVSVEQALLLEPLTADELARKLDVSPTQVLEVLTTMLLNNTLKEDGGRYYVD